MSDAHRDEIAKLEALYAEHPEGRIFTHLAEACRKAGDLERAREVLSDGIERHPDYSSAHVVLGRVLVDEGRTEEAGAEFRRVLELDNHNLVALRALGDLARASGDTDSALDFYQRLLDVEPADDEVKDLVAALADGGAAPAEAPDVAPGSDWDAEPDSTMAVEEPAASEADEPGEAAWSTEAPDADSWAMSSTDWQGGDLDEAPLDEPAEPEAPFEEMSWPTPESWGAASDALPSDHEAPAEEPVAEEPVGEEPIVEEPVGEEPVVEEPVASTGSWITETPEAEPEEAVADEVVADEADLALDEPWVEPPGGEPVADAAAPENEVVDESTDEPLDEAADELEVETFEAEVLEVETFRADEDVAEAVDEAELGGDDAWAGAAAIEEEPAPEPPDEEPAPPTASPGVMTETIAQVYARQGLYDRAAEVYRQLVRERPEDAGLRDRLDEMERLAAHEAAMEAEEPALEGFESGELDTAGVSPEPIAGLETDDVDAETGLRTVDEPEATTAWTGGDWSPADDETPYAWADDEPEPADDSPPIQTYLRSLLSWSGDEPAASEAPEAPDEPAASDESDVSDVSDVSEPEVPESSAAESDDDDLEMFRSWLESLKQ